MPVVGWARGYYATTRRLLVSLSHFDLKSLFTLPGFLSLSSCVPFFVGGIIRI